MKEFLLGATCAILIGAALLHLVDETYRWFFPAQPVICAEPPPLPRPEHADRVVLLECPGKEHSVREWVERWAPVAAAECAEEVPR